LVEEAMGLSGRPAMGDVRLEGGEVDFFEVSHGRVLDGR
jgi:hypothetical protein